ncbi:hypothetical protein ERO13_D04G096580v2 [Gossypium hirsutum]|nr:hypothetical protein ERO13_D04G096580v2 [Gossypium hirsutum]
MEHDCIKYVRSCQQCQIYADKEKVLIPLNNMTTPWPKKPSPTFELPRQELYARTEAPKGELGIFLIGDQSDFPWKWKIRPPSFINLQILPQLVKRMKLADIMTILGSIDIIMGEVDR